MLHVPTAIHEFDRQPIEQFRVSRPLSLRPQIVQHFGQAVAVHQFPHPVDERSRRQRIAAGGHPVGQIQSRQVLFRRRIARQEDRKCGIDHLAGFVHPIAARQDPHRARRDALGNQHGRDFPLEPVPRRSGVGQLRARFVQQRRMAPPIIGHQFLLRFAPLLPSRRRRAVNAVRQPGFVDPGIIDGNDRQPEPTDIMPVFIGAMRQGDSQGLAFVLQRHRFGEREYRPAVLFLLVAFHRPSGLIVIVDGPGDLESLLRKIRCGPSQRHRFLPLAFGVDHVYFHVGQHEVTAAPGKAAAVERRMRQGFQPQPRDPGLNPGKRRPVNVRFGIFAGHEYGTVRQRFQGGSLRRFEPARGDRFPDQSSFPLGLGDLPFPVQLPVDQGFGRSGQHGFQASDPGFQIRQFLLLLRRGQRQLGFPAASGVVTLFLQVGEKRGETIKILAGERIELVIMAFGATHRGTQPNAGSRAHPVGRILGQVFFVLGPAFGSDHMQPIVPGGDPLFAGGFRQQIAGQLLPSELIEREIPVEGVDDVIPVRPNAVGLIAMVADGVGVSH